jgi:serine protease inhibitor
LSGPSVTLALSMLYNGATGLTQQEMAWVLGIEALSLDEVNAANAALLARVQRADPKVQIHSAQSLWLHNGFRL